MSAHTWRYHLSGRIGDPPPTVAEALSSPHVRLYRDFEPVGAEAVLLPDGSWRGTHLFLDIRAKGELANLIELDAVAARAVVSAWRDEGRVSGEPADLVEVAVPADYAERADERAARQQGAEDLRTAGLPADAVVAVRTALFGEPDLAPAWVDVPDRVVVPVSYPAVLLFDEDRGHLVDAYRDLGATELWLVTREPEVNGDLPPDGVPVPLTVAALGALSRLAYLGDYVLTDSARTAVLMHLEDYWLVAGPAAFVTDVLGSSIPGAFAAFRDHADEADHTVRPVLIGVLDRYPPSS